MYNFMWRCISKIVNGYWHVFSGYVVRKNFMKKLVLHLYICLVQVEKWRHQVIFCKDTETIWIVIGT